MKLIVIDMQKVLLVDELYKCNEILNRVIKLVNAARKNGVEVIFVKHDAGENSGFSDGDEGFDIVDSLTPLDNEKVFAKTINSAFGNADFSSCLEESGDKDLMIVGLQTEFCIDATIKSAFEKGYKVYFPQGCNSTFDNGYMKARKAIKYYNEWIWNGTFGECVSISEAIMFLKSKK